MRIIIASGRPGEVKLVHHSLSLLNARRHVTALIHGCVDRCTPAAEAWARARDVLVVRYPANWWLHGSGATATAYRAMLRDSRPDTVLIMPGGKHAATLVDLAEEAGIEIARPGAGVLWDVDLVDELRGLPHRLAGASSVMLAAAAR